MEELMNIFVSNLDRSVTAHDLRRAFSGYGTIVKATVQIDCETGKPLGHGHVHLVPEQAAREAIEELHLAPLRGRPIKVRECVYRANGDRRVTRRSGLTSERRQAQERRRQFSGVNPLDSSPPAA
jgi:RNA recognition motif-containing protein